MSVYKLTNQSMQTHNGYQWALAEWRATNGKGDLCGPGWLHAYDDPLLAVLLNPVHANLARPRLFEATGAGERRDDRGLKCAYTRLRLDKEIPLPTVTTEQRVRFAIGCALAVYHESGFIAWANAWLTGADRREGRAARAAAWEAVAAARAALAAAWALAEGRARAAGALVGLSAIAQWAVSDQVLP